MLNLNGRAGAAVAIEALTNARHLRKFYQAFGIKLPGDLKLI